MKSQHYPRLGSSEADPEMRIQMQVIYERSIRVVGLGDGFDMGGVGGRSEGKKD